MAIILDAILTSSKGIEVLNNYPYDKATFADEILNYLRDQFSRDTASYAERNIFVLRAIELAIRRAYPFSRGETFAMLAKHLAKHQTANDFIRQLLERTRARDVEERRKEISDLLAKGLG